MERPTDCHSGVYRNPTHVSNFLRARQVVPDRIASDIALGSEA